MIRDFIKFLILIITLFVVLSIIMFSMIKHPAYGYMLSSEDLHWLQSDLKNDFISVSIRPKTEVRYVSCTTPVSAIDMCGNEVVLTYGQDVNYVLNSVDSNDMVELIIGDGSYFFPRQYLRNSKPIPKEYKYIGIFSLTAYAHTGNRCANGLYPRKNRTIAAHTRDFPLGTILYIEGYGEYIVDDRGGFPKGTIDIYMHDKNDCISFGRRKAKVYLIKLGDNKRYSPEKVIPKQ